jgi:hypothetical protein
MPTVTLSREWTDLQGNTHPAGEVLRVDDITAARLHAEGHLDALGGGVSQAETDGPGLSAVVAGKKPSGEGGKKPSKSGKAASSDGKKPSGAPTLLDGKKPSGAPTLIGGKKPSAPPPLFGGKKPSDGDA